MKKNMRIGLMCIGAFLLTFCISAFNRSDSFAESAGGWIGSGSPGTGGNGGGGGWAGGCYGAPAAYLLECQGYSWIFYRYVGGSNYPGDTPFRPDSSYNNISGECAKHGGAGGFWHFGWNMRALSYNGYGYFGDLSYVKGLSGARVTYSTREGGRGHKETFTPKMVRSGGIYSWANGYVKSNGDLNHTIYSDGKAAYQAYKYGSEATVLKDYKQAYKAVTGKDYTGGAMPNDTYAFCWWPGMEDNGKSAFEGTSSVIKGDSDITWGDATEKADTPWVNKAREEKTGTLVTYCGNEGCEISFRHFLSRSSGNGGTNYSISGLGISGTKSADEFSGKDWLGLNNNTVRMYPGQQRCETLTFSVNGGTNSNDMAKSTVCAEVKAKEEAKETEEADIKIESMNDKVAKYGTYGNRTIYAKPGDKISFRAIYNPSPQNVYERINNNSLSVQGIDMNSWKNAFAVTSNIGFSGNYAFDNGDSNEKVVPLNTHDVNNGSDVGEWLTEDAIIDPEGNAEVWATPTKYTVDNGAANVETTPKSSRANVIVPYNFDTSINIDLESGKSLSAGETEKVNYSMKVLEKGNSATTNGGDEKYKTLMRDVMIKSVVYVGGEKEGNIYGDGDGIETNLCKYFGYDENNNLGDCNQRIDPEIRDSVTEGIDGYVLADVPDKPAGTGICVAVAVYPAYSGDDDTSVSKQGSNTWRISNSKCFKLAKKPSVQVWGGNVAANNIFAPYATKNLGDNYGVRLFGSWGELAVASGNNSKMASGAAWGYASNNSGVLQPNPIDGTNTEGDPGGGTNTDNCDSDVLTFGSGCGMFEELGGGSGEMNESTIAAMAEHIKEELNVPNENIHSNVSEIKLGEEDLVSDELYENSGDIYILTNIKINRNNSDNKLSKLGDAPQVVIYAKNINIACNVGRIDAILIAEETINTCADIEEKVLKESSAAQNQLIINGAMYAKDIKFNRTYGAGTGTRSIVPAEIVNYDNSMLFTGGGGGTPTGGSMDVVYVRELAPRYKDN